MTTEKNKRKICLVTLILKLSGLKIEYNDVTSIEKIREHALDDGGIIKHGLMCKAASSQANEAFPRKIWKS